MKHPLFKKKMATIKMLFAILLIIFSFTGCYFYKVHSTQKLVEKDFETFKKKSKTYILHTGNNVWEMRGVRFTNDSVFAKLVVLIGHDKYKTTNPAKANRYKDNKKDKEVIHEIHMYTSLPFDRPQMIVLPLKDIYNIEIYDIDLVSTIAATTALTIGTGVAVAGIGAIIIILTKSSCPFVYIKNGENYALCGEIYSGAIHRPLERHDYLPLPGLAVHDGLYSLKISNEVKEIQNTNLAELWVVDHSKNIQVCIDKYGNLHTLSDDDMILYSVTDFSAKDLKPVIVTKDTISYPLSKLSSSESPTDSILLQANIPDSITTVKLLVNARNTFFLDYSFSKFYDLFGVAYHKWQDIQDTASRDSLMQWSLDQHIPLLVYTKKQNKWVIADYFNVIGPMAFKEDIMSIKIDSLTDKPLQIKLEFGINFWDIDYLALNASKDFPLDIIKVPVKQATDEKGSDISSLILQDDSAYYSQPEVGNYALLNFEAPKAGDAQRSVFLHSKGYYRILRDPSGLPDLKYLKSFKKAGSFNKFASELLNVTKIAQP